MALSSRLALLDRPGAAHCSTVSCAYPENNVTLQVLDLKALNDQKEQFEKLAGEKEKQRQKEELPSKMATVGWR